MKKLLFVYLMLIGLFVLYVYQYQTDDTTNSQWSDKELRGTIDENYVMVTFQSGIDYWKRALKGFEDAAEALNVSVEYRGATQYDVNEQITVLEQVIAKKPAGIAVSAMDPVALNDVINKAVDAGIPIVMFDANAPDSKAFSFLGTDNYYAGTAAAHKMAELLNEKGQIGIVTHPKQLNHQERTNGFRDTIASDYPDMEIVATQDGRGDQMTSKEVVDEMIRDFPELKGVFASEANGGVGVGQSVLEQQKKDEIRIISFDTDKGTLDMVEEGVISATLAQGTWKMGYWSLQYLFHIQHDLANDVEAGTNLPRYVDTGITFVTKENVDEFYPNE
ncbi:monosaccharide ABC transporter substrate-binding protein, CUT2 family (TC 3.A.1.2.-) [Gracilibacillus ureilyticus]|uniref:Monosaccharide ABC transporter substrate-binding protein, CUT2 family (TC 3.A.1.2.-) n=1 Tax=Gracilibacillus ureilyticus TaxID=531814 RepID=A0A1H9NH79_9BACI|nr:substrate-binding domain-containing protein [Gracilibacillus ureilyticus]SER35248.1 monosaccharide ABC transporter substrate-binding protein, CUT2 family (TC 3.A.1.2.-) [Gracilibacillus ureilyticus]